ncbi:hypothetical protein CEXT_73791 [Caerostris extrusa]|uniref:Uncharacterized protein n=1 Tax=Caerostris extrusa TaxID=172846 RepID=A0AAV4QDT6_CAEEX|nr:hypothetical protein CEXT_73791 [Caerostris extrusa]
MLSELILRKSCLHLCSIFRDIRVSHPDPELCLWEHRHQKCGATLCPETRTPLGDRQQLAAKMKSVRGYSSSALSCDSSVLMSIQEWIIASP